MPNGGNPEPSSGERAKRWLKNAQITASIAANVVNPLAGPVADRVSGDTSKPPVDMSQRAEENANKDWARWKLVQMQRQAGDVPQAAPGSKRQRDPGR